jgi:hypothetical protein
VARKPCALGSLGTLGPIAVIAACAAADGPSKGEPVQLETCGPGTYRHEASGACVEAGLPPDMPCPPGAWPDARGSCPPAGLPPDMPCPPGEAPADGGCVPAGVPPGGCAAGFVHDGDRGCTPILPAEPCPSGELAVPGDARCRLVAPCGAPPWGEVALEPGAVFVDAAHVGASDGSEQKPFKSLAAAIAAAPDGGLVVVAAGSYVGLLVVDRALRIHGRCPALVEIAGAGPEGAIAVVGAKASGARLGGLAVTGPGRCLHVDGAKDVELERLHVHDCPDRGLYVTRYLGDTSVGLRDSLIERAAGSGVSVFGARAAVERSVIRDSVVDATQKLARGLEAFADLAAGATVDVLVRGSLVERHMGNGVLAAGGRLEIDASVVRATGRDATNAPAAGVGAQGHASLGERSTLLVRASLIEEHEGAAVVVLGADAEIERSVVRGPLPDVPGTDGVLAQPDLATGALGSLAVRGSLVERTSRGISARATPAVLEAVAVRRTLAPDGQARAVVLGGAGDEPGAAMSVRHSLIEQNEGVGIGQKGGALEVVGCAIRDTLPGSDGLGAAVVTEHAGSERSPTTLALGSSELAGTAGIGLLVIGSEVSAEDTVIRTTRASSAYGHGRAVHANHHPDAAGRLVLRRVLVEDTDGHGIAAAGPVPTAIEGCIVERTRSVGPGTGYGVLAQRVIAPAGGESVRLDGCLLRDNAHAAVGLFGSEGRIHGTLASGSSAPEARYCVVVQAEPGLPLPQPSAVTVERSLLERCTLGGVLVRDSRATLEAVRIRDTRPSAEGRYGDGLLAASVGGPTDVTASHCIIEESARAATSFFGPVHGKMESTHLRCQLFDIDEEPSDAGAPAVVLGEDLACGCAEPALSCRIVSAGLVPPVAPELPPPGPAP